MDNCESMLLQSDIVIMVMLRYNCHYNLPHDYTSSIIETKSLLV